MKRRKIKRRWKNKSIVAQQKKASRWNRKYRGATKDDGSVKSKVSRCNKRRRRGEIQSIVLDLKKKRSAETTRSWWIWKEADRQRLHDCGELKKYRAGCANVRAGPKVFHPHFKSQKQFGKQNYRGGFERRHLGKNKKLGEIQNVKEQKAKSGKYKSCTEIRK